MKKTCYGFLFVVFFALLIFSGCEKKEPQFSEYELNANYTVIYSMNDSTEGKDNATRLSEAINKTGLNLKVYSDITNQNGNTFEILVGETNRAESTDAITELKKNDFVILLNGNRIIILGGCSTATTKAVDYFINNCITAENKILLPNKPYYNRAEYKVEKLSVLGKPIEEYTIATKGLTYNDKLIVNNFIERITGICGVTVKMADSFDTAGENVFRFIRNNSVKSEINVSDNSIEIVGGGEYGLVVAFHEFMSNFIIKTHAKELDVMISNKKVDIGNKVLIDLNLLDSYAPMDIDASTEGIFKGFEIARAELPDEITIVAPLNPEDYPYSIQNTLFVSPNGSDANLGGIDEPLRTIQAALDKMNGAGGGVIYLREGNYNINETLKITKNHSGTEVSPLFISAYNGENARISYGIDIPVTSFKSVTDKYSLSRLDEEAVTHIVSVDLSEVGINKGDIAKYTQTNRPIVLINSKKGTLARYPNDGEWLTMGEVLSKNPAWEFKLTDNRHLYWSDDNDVWLYGSLWEDWEKNHYPVDINLANKSISSTTPSALGIKYKANNTYYLYNIFEELDSPGEWYIDFDSNILYIYPDGELESVTICTENDDIFDIKDAKNVVIDSLDITGTLGSGIASNNGYQVVIQNCYIHDCGDYGVKIDNGTKCGVIYSKFINNTNTQCYVRGGDTAKLLPSHNFIQNCTFKSSGKQNGTEVYGVGFVISHNLYDGTVSKTGGNEYVIEYNEFNGASLNTSDSGAIYTGGGDALTHRGYHIRYNYVHNIQSSHAGVYIDEMGGGGYVYGNIVQFNEDKIANKKWSQAYRTHTGREVVFWNNVSINTYTCAFGDNENYFLPNSDSNWVSRRNNIISIGKNFAESEAYSERYPTYVEWYNDVKKNLEESAIKGYTRNENEDSVRGTEYCTYGNNIIINAVRPYEISNYGLKTAGGLNTNYICKDTPFDENYNLTDVSAVQAMPDWEELPFEKMGLCD